MSIVPEWATVVEESSGWFRFIGPEFAKQCPHCDYENYLSEWRFNFAENYREDEQVIQDAKMYNPDMTLYHSLYHFPECY